MSARCILRAVWARRVSGWLLPVLLFTAGRAHAQFAYITNSQTLSITITGYTGADANVTIPAMIDGYPVTAIGDSAFKHSSVAAIALPNSVSTLGDQAFFYCYSLTSMTIPNSVTRIGDGAFGGCSGLTNVTIGEGVTSIGFRAFDACSSLTNITVEAANPTYAGTGGVLLNRALTELVQFPAGLSGGYVIPNSVTSIGASAFADCSSLRNVTIPNSVTSIADVAFGSCSGLTNVTIGNSVSSLGVGAFYGCSSLTSLAIPNSVSTIGSSAFARCSGLTSMTIPNSVTTIGAGAFAYCSRLTSMTIPNSVTTIGSSAFAECSRLKRVYFVGNAPGPGDALLGGTATVYYLPGSTGWAATFRGLRTKLWNPRVQTADGQFGFREGKFGFNLSGTPDIPVRVEASGDLGGAWTALFTGTLTNRPVYFSYPQAAQFPNRFYRVTGP